MRPGPRGPGSFPQFRRTFDNRNRFNEARAARPWKYQGSALNKRGMYGLQ